MNYVQLNKIIFKGKQNIQWNFRWNYYKGTLLVRINDNGLFLYDIINIKKRRVRRENLNDHTVKNRLFYVNYVKCFHFCQVNYLCGLCKLPV